MYGGIYERENVPNREDCDEDRTDLQLSANDDMIMTNPDLEKVKGFISHVHEGSATETDITDSDMFKSIQLQIDIFKQTLSDAQTASILFQYLDMINILRRFIMAERMSNWDLNLHALL